KAALLIALLPEAGKDDVVALLLINALLSFSVLEALLKRFWDSVSPEQLQRNADWLHALCRYGTRFASALLPALCDRTPAARTLGLLRDERHFRELASAARHPEASIRQSGLRALADLGDARAGDLLVAATRANDPQERRLSVEALGRVQAPAAVPHLTLMLAD